MSRIYKQMQLMLLGLVAMLFFGGLSNLYAEDARFSSEVPTAVPKVETDPVRNDDDAADDPAVWIHPTDPGRSTILGTDKREGLSVYDLSGREIQWLPDGRFNNVDVRYNFPLDGSMVDIVAVSNQSDRTIVIYRVDPASGHLTRVSSIPTADGMQVYGLCMYHSRRTGGFHVFVTESPYGGDEKFGRVQQYELYSPGSGTIAGRLVRSFSIGGETEGCVADDEFGHIYFAETLGAIWKYGAEPQDGDDRTLVDNGNSNRFQGELEGISLYYASDGTGYLIVHDQGGHYFLVYRREGNNDFVMTFRVGSGDGIDEVSGTDGLDVTNAALNSTFPQGVFIAHDNHNHIGNTETPDEGSNYKLVPWESVAAAGAPQLTTDTSWSPRYGGATTPVPTPTPTPLPDPFPTATLPPATPLPPDATVTPTVTPEPTVPGPSPDPTPDSDPTPEPTVEPPSEEEGEPGIWLPLVVNP